MGSATISPREGMPGPEPEAAKSTETRAVECAKRGSVGDADVRGALLHADPVQPPLHLGADRGAALVQDRIFRLVVQQSRDREALLLAQRQLGLPVNGVR